MKPFKFDNRRYVRSPDLTRLMVGKKLTDARIAYYQERGRYGPPTEKPKLVRKRKNPTLEQLEKEFA